MRREIILTIGLAAGSAGLVLGCSSELRGQERSGDQQIAEAIAAAPESMQADATVIGYRGTPRPNDPLTTLREGSNELICHSDDPDRDGFTTACYHQDLDAYMSIGRVQRAEGKGGRDVMAARFAALEAGQLSLPDHPSSLYVLSGEDVHVDPATGAVTGGSRRMVIYVPYATADQVGLSPQPGDGRPWLMMGGLPWAHIMIDQ
jgi:hypothetical protein